MVWWGWGQAMCPVFWNLARSPFKYILNIKGRQRSGLLAGRCSSLRNALWILRCQYPLPLKIVSTVSLPLWKLLSVFWFGVPNMFPSCAQLLSVLGPFLLLPWRCWESKQMWWLPWTSEGCKNLWLTEKDENNFFPSFHDIQKHLIYHNKPFRPMMHPSVQKNLIWHNLWVNAREQHWRWTRNVNASFPYMVCHGKSRADFSNCTLERSWILSH